MGLPWRTGACQSWSASQSRRTQHAHVPLCEQGEVETLYDTRHGIPLYSAIVLDSTHQLSGTKTKRNGQWHDAGDWPDNQRKKIDKWPNGNRAVRLEYTSKYEANKAIKHVDNRWQNAAQKSAKNHLVGSRYVAAIDRGHLVASSYAKISHNTFTMQNIVPQFAASNQGEWQRCETGFFTWAKRQCYERNKEQYADIKVYVLVGTVPSFISNKYNTYPALRYFGKGGPRGAAAFSDLYDPNRSAFNVPDALWTAACCIVKDNKGDIVSKRVMNTAFYLENIPVVDQTCERSTVKDLFNNFRIRLSRARSNTVNLFPAVPECSDPRYYYSVV